MILHFIYDNLDIMIIFDKKFGEAQPPKNLNYSLSEPILHHILV